MYVLMRERTSNGRSDKKSNERNERDKAYVQQKFRVHASVSERSSKNETKVAANQPVTDGKTLRRKCDLRSWEKVSLFEGKNRNN